MAPIKLSTTAWFDSLLPRDGIQINPVVNTTAGVTDAEGLVNDWMTALKGWSTKLAAVQLTVKAYDVSKPKPNYPLFEKTDNPGMFTVSTCPRELALCLSFYATNNVKRRRGRLYVPFNWWATAAAIPVRPGANEQTKVGELASILQDLGGVDVDWSVYSKVDGTARAVTDWWVDNEWDIQRMRGLRGTARTEGTTSEDSTRERQIA